MKKLFCCAASAILVLSLASCGGSSQKKSQIFGEVPGMYIEASQDLSKIEEKMVNSSSDAKLEKYNAKREKAKEEWTSKIEKAAQEWSGSQLEMKATPQFTVSQPLTVEYVNIQHLCPEYSLKGEVKAAADYPIEYRSEAERAYRLQHPDDLKYIYVKIQLVGTDAEGKELFREDIANMHPQILDNGEIGIKTGTVAELSQLFFRERDAEAYSKTVEMHLEYKNVPY